MTVDEGSYQIYEAGLETAQGKKVYRNGPSRKLPSSTGGVIGTGDYLLIEVVAVGAEAIKPIENTIFVYMDIEMEKNYKFVTLLLSETKGTQGILKQWQAGQLELSTPVITKSAYEPADEISVLESHKMLAFAQQLLNESPLLRILSAIIQQTPNTNALRSELANQLEQRARRFIKEIGAAEQFPFGKYILKDLVADELEERVDLVNNRYISLLQLLFKSPWCTITYTENKLRFLYLVLGSDWNGRLTIDDIGDTKEVTYYLQMAMICYTMMTRHGEFAKHTQLLMDALQWDIAGATRFLFLPNINGRPDLSFERLALFLSAYEYEKFLSGIFRPYGFFFLEKKTGTRCVTRLWPLSRDPNQKQNPSPSLSSCASLNGGA